MPNSLLTALLLSAAAMPALAEPSLRDLSGTGWQLVKIASMNDTVARPTADGDYQLRFGIDGSVSVAAGCNRGRGALSTFDPPQIVFSQLATTRALCPPDSLSERYLAELGWVRSYVYQNGHLYLATMADGSILEFTPLHASEASAVAGDLSLITDDPDALRSIILGRLLEAYAEEHGVTVSNQEIARYLERMDQRLREELGDNYEDTSGLSDEEQAKLQRMRQQMAASAVQNWKVSRALYEQYGGRIIYQQVGPEPLDAYRLFLTEAAKGGAFEITDGDVATRFWSFFSDDQRHDFMAEGSEAALRAFDHPPWTTAE